MTHVQRTGPKCSDGEPRPGTHPHAKGFFRAAATWFLAALLLAGCAGPSALDEEAAKKFQARVVAAKQLAVQQDFRGAKSELEQLDREVQAAADQGRLSQERQSRIEASIAKVGADLDAALAAAQPQPIPTVSAQEPKGEPDGKGKGEDAKKEENKDENKGEGKGD